MWGIFPRAFELIRIRENLQARGSEVATTCYSLGESLERADSMPATTRARARHIFLPLLVSQIFSAFSMRIGALSLGLINSSSQTIGLMTITKI